MSSGTYESLSLAIGYTLLQPSKTNLDPDVLNSYPLLSMVTVTVSNSAADICDATNRFQTSVYSLNWSEVNESRIASGSRFISVGLIASCASCMSLFLFENELLEQYSLPNLLAINSDAASFAADDILTESVRK